ACEHILPSVLRQLKKEHPQCLLSILPGDTQQALAWLDANAVDLALCLQPRGPARHEFQPLFEDEMMFITSPAHPWAVSGRVVREEIARQNYILYSQSSYTSQLVADYFRQEDIVLNAVIELGSMEAIKEFVKLELGVSIVAPWIAETETKDGSLAALPLGRRKLRR